MIRETSVSIPTAAGVTASVYAKRPKRLGPSVSIPTAAGVTASLGRSIRCGLDGLNSHCCRGYCIEVDEMKATLEKVSIPTAAGVTASKSARGELTNAESQFPLLQGLLHLREWKAIGWKSISLNSHCCRGYCISRVA